MGAKSGINLFLLPSSESVEGNLGMRSREAANPNGMREGHKKEGLRKE